MFPGNLYFKNALDVIMKKFQVLTNIYIMNNIINQNNFVNVNIIHFSLLMIYI